ncbi:hypothetical protein [uncultured Aquimarina sp.]|uniref:hypothetical protein n=1 Tax=uncultured Aquimarina sp. TaxID=575652 RepID=UPI0026129F9B|nr:hypothetical protein [uncultured Aquimarina sp.]
MIEEELIRIWKSSSKEEQIKFEKSKLIIDLQANIDRFNKKIKYRDLRETIPAIIMIPVFGHLAYNIPFVISKIGAIIILLWCIYVIIRIRSLKKHKPVPTTTSYLNYLLETKKYLAIQKKLLDDVLYWCVIPSFIGVFVFFIGINPDPLALIGPFILLSLIGVVIYLLNKHASKVEFVPRLERIDKALKDLEEYEDT